MGTPLLHQLVREPSYLSRRQREQVNACSASEGTQLSVQEWGWGWHVSWENFEKLRGEVGTRDSLGWGVERLRDKVVFELGVGGAH